MEEVETEEEVVAEDQTSEEEVVAEEEVTEEEVTELPEITDEVDIDDDVNALLGGQELSEEFREKAKTIFEAALKSKVTELREAWKKLTTKQSRRRGRRHERRTHRAC